MYRNTANPQTNKMLNCILSLRSLTVEKIHQKLRYNCGLMKYSRNWNDAQPRTVFVESRILVTAKVASGL